MALTSYRLHLAYWIPRFVKIQCHRFGAHLVIAEARVYFRSCGKSIAIITSRKK